MFPRSHTHSIAKIPMDNVLGLNGLQQSLEGRSELLEWKGIRNDTTISTKGM